MLRASEGVFDPRFSALYLPLRDAVHHSLKLMMLHTLHATHSIQHCFIQLMYIINVSINVNVYLPNVKVTVRGVCG